MILSKLLRETNMVVHGFFNKKNGFSKGIYKSLNCGLGSKDNKEKIINWKIFIPIIPDPKHVIL